MGVAQNPTVDAGQGEAQKASSSESLEKYRGFTPAQVEALFSLFKEREDKEKMSGKYVRPVQWVLDSGASHHMTFDRNIFSTLSRLPAVVCVTITNGQQDCQGGGQSI